ncbi:uncharacterized protein CEXT_488961 [Caerostris extrusa]|uniref:SOSS complex subunit C homolog n=1 Tax=Caerostris extrusa TaxID=172846 RepID=A0AAV4QG85_CAEEX|nr:uncharacterized protein CEXT_488961 [Caerostris extrusa]
MSFKPPSAKQEQQNLKVLEEVQLQKKKLMLKQAGNVSLNSTAASSTAPLSPSIAPIPSGSAVSPQGANASEHHALNKNQRVALQHACSNSFCSFIPQDSSYGNLILPVLPRFDK